MNPNPASIRLPRSVRKAGDSLLHQEEQQASLDQLLRPLQLGASGRVTSSKALGAYYTDLPIADFLVRWAILTGRESVLDPGAGEGVFLAAAAERLRGLGGAPQHQVYGVEIDEVAHRRLVSRSGGGSPLAKILHADFFSVEVTDLPPVDVVVGNPPFVRYQRFNGEMRLKALRRAREVGVEISQLASSWAPFLVYAVRFVRPEGRLAMVVPMELAQAAYARPVLTYLCDTFREVRILTFARRLFPGLSEDTVLLLAAGRGQPFERLALLDLPDSSVLERYSNPPRDLPEGIDIDASAVTEARTKLLHHLLPQHTLDLYRELQRSPRTASLGELANVGIGYVTGDNDYFHVDG